MGNFSLISTLILFFNAYLTEKKRGKEDKILITRNGLLNQRAKKCIIFGWLLKYMFTNQVYTLSLLTNKIDSKMCKMIFVHWENFLLHTDNEWRAFFCFYVIIIISCLWCWLVEVEVGLDNNNGSRIDLKRYPTLTGDYFKIKQTIQRSRLVKGLIKSDKIFNNLK